MTALPTTAKVGVIGAGTMGAGIAQVAANAGHSVLLYDVADGAAQAGIDQIAKGLNKLVAKGKKTQDEVDQLMGRLSPVSELDAFKDCALVIEVIVENLEIKKKLFAELEDICGDDAILATNTSSISITSIAADLKRPGQLVGMHFFNPAPIMKLVEVVSGLATLPEVAETIHQTATVWGKNAVYAKSTPGFIVNRVARPFYAEGLRILQEGAADIATIDAAMRECGGFRMGPFELMDLIGHDVNYAVTNSVYNAFYNDQRFLPSLIQKELIEAGRLGRKSSFGFYDYRDGAEKDAPHTAAAEDFVLDQTVVFEGGVDPISSLLAAVRAKGMTHDIPASNDNQGPARIRVGDATLMLTDGRFASVRAADEDITNLVVFDLALDYTKATRIVIAPADQTSAFALDDAVAFFQALGKDVSVINDVAGLIVMRTVSMLANEGADAVFQQVCSVADVDIAMKGGVNYPCGPMEWADQVGVETIYRVLSGLESTYGEDRYRLSPLLLKAQATSLPLSSLNPKD